MKLVISGNELKEKIKETLTLLCGTVKTTLGPKGMNVIIDHSSFKPFITNDGVTIAQNIESEDAVINTILELAKEASIKTNDSVGDGTTTTLVLLEAIYNECLNYDINPIILKRELNDSLKKVIHNLVDNSWKPSDNDILSVLKTASNSEDIANTLFEAYKKVGCNITIKEGNMYETYREYLDGYNLETDVVSQYYFKNCGYVDNSCVLLTDKLEYLDDINLKSIIDADKSLFVIANDYSNEVINEALSLFMNDNIKLYLLRYPGYGSEKIKIFNELKTIIGEYNSIVNVDGIIFNKEFITIQNHNLKKLSTIEVDNSNNISNGLVNIYVCAYTDTERRELKMRYDDALCALKNVINGVLPGSGISLYKISEKLDDSIGDKILSTGLKAPLFQILYNSGIDYDIVDKIKDLNYSKIYNVNTNTFELISESSVLDTLNVVENEIINAISIASMLITTNSLVVNEYTSNVNKISEYTEL